jgi:putative tryptophan/tyrosine transport system substrate-binding protein
LLCGNGERRDSEAVTGVASVDGEVLMRRRTVIGGLAAAAFSISARAQQPATPPVIGILGSASPQPWTARLRAFREGLGEIGYVEGQNLSIEYRWAEGRNERLPALAAELVASKVSVIVVLRNTHSAVAAKAATDTIPIVFRIAVDPMEFGLVHRMNQPGGNLTGVTTLGVEVGPKQLELFHELLSSTTTIGALVNPSNPGLTAILARELPAAAQRLGVQLHLVSASSDDALDRVFTRLKELQAGGLVIGADTFFNSRNERIASLALRNAMPTISPYREFVEAGGLMSYGGSIADASRLAGVYTGRILRGEKPGELPVLRATKFEFLINLRTARALGITVPLILQAQADEVIE